MKRVMIGVLAAMVLNACMQDIPVPYSGGGREVRFTTGGGERTAVEGEGRTKWLEGDGIGIYMTGRKNGSILAGNVEYRSNGANGFSVANSGQTIRYPEGSGKVDFTTYYPYMKPLEDRYIPVDLTDQSGEDRGAALDLLWVKADKDGEGYDQDSGAVNLVFAHTFSKLSVTVQSDGKLDLTGMAAMITGVNRQARFDIRNGAVSSPGDRGEITPLCTAEPGGTEKGGRYEAVLLPGGTGGTAMEFMVNGKTYTWNIDSTFGGFAGGKEYHAAITVYGNKTLTVTATGGGVWTDSNEMYTTEGSKTLTASDTSSGAAWTDGSGTYTTDGSKTLTASDTDGAAWTDSGRTYTTGGSKTLTASGTGDAGWASGETYTVQSSWPYGIEGYSGTVTVTYTDNTYITTTDLTLKDLVRGKTIKSVTLVDRSNKTYLVGRVVDFYGPLRLKFNGAGDLVFRDAGDGGYIPIGSYAEFQLIRTNAALSKDKKFKQEADLDLMDVEWVPVTNDGAFFSGEFNGGGNTLSNLKIDQSAKDYQGLFSRNMGTIRNVHIASGAVRGEWYCGAVCGRNESTGSMISCSNGADVTGTDGVSDGILGGSKVCYDTGGVVGRNDGGSIVACRNTGAVSGGWNVGGVVGTNSLPDFAGYSSIMTGCSNAGAVSGKSNVGGVVGMNSISRQASGNITMNGCYNTGKVSGNSTSDRIGGVAGYNTSSSLTCYIFLIDCYNTGEVNGRSYIGGVVGESSSIFTRCYNTGTVAGTGDNSYYIGGVAGVVTRGSMTDCYNTGAVSGGNQVGGVAGTAGSAGSGTDMTGCYNTGRVSGTSSIVGGVVGHAYNGSVDGCYNTGAVSGGGYVGGVAGSNTLTMTGCYNTGVVMSDGTYPFTVGGVAGRNSRTMTGCYNTGAVSGLQYAGGVAGETSGSSAAITGCYNTGAVSGTSGSIGGVAGRNSNQSKIIACYNTGNVSGAYGIGGVAGWNDDSSSITVCYNTGKVSGTSYYIGGVAGQNTQNGSITACYNTGGVSGTNMTGGVVGYVQYGSTIIACYWFDQGNTAANNVTWGIGSMASNTNAEKFGASAWPAPDVHADWGTGLSGTAGQYWRSTGGWNNGNPVYPVLWWE